MHIGPHDAQEVVHQLLEGLIDLVDAQVHRIVVVPCEAAKVLEVTRVQEREVSLN